MDVTGSLRAVLGLGEGSVENAGGSVSALVGLGVGSLTAGLTPLLDGLTTASGVAPDAGK